MLIPEPCLTWKSRIFRAGGLEIGILTSSSDVQESTKRSTSQHITVVGVLADYHVQWIDRITELYLFEFPMSFLPAFVHSTNVINKLLPFLFLLKKTKLLSPLPGPIWSGIQMLLSHLPGSMCIGQITLFMCVFVCEVSMIMEAPSWGKDSSPTGASIKHLHGFCQYLVCL